MHSGLQCFLAAQDLVRHTNHLLCRCSEEELRDERLRALPVAQPYVLDHHWATAQQQAAAAAAAADPVAQLVDSRADGAASVTAGAAAGTAAAGADGPVSVKELETAAQSAMADAARDAASAEATEPGGAAAQQGRCCSGYRTSSGTASRRRAGRSRNSRCAGCRGDRGAAERR